VSSNPKPAAEIGLTHEVLMQFVYRAPIGLIQTTLDGSVELINPMAASLLIPLSPSGLLDNLFRALGVVAPRLPSLVAAFDRPSGTVIDALRVPLSEPGASGTRRIISMSIIKLDPLRLMATLADVTLEVQREQEALALQLRKAARLDTLTQMPNRAAMRDLIQQAIDLTEPEAGDQFAVVFINCDRFKDINDSLGQTVGDEVLGMMAERLRTTLRQRTRSSTAGGPESLAARVGGDEFVALLADLVHGDEVHALAQRVLAVLGQPYESGPTKSTAASAWASFCVRKWIRVPTRCYATPALR